MKNLALHIFNAFQKLKSDQRIVPNSVPILWFGDLNKYRKSNTKIITVSLNPSNNEFGNIKKEIPYNTQ